MDTDENKIVANRHNNSSTRTVLVAKRLHRVVRFEERGESETLGLAGSLLAHHARHGKRRVGAKVIRQQLVVDLIAEVADKEADVVCVF